jgi:lipoprotein-releasing system permease protein
MQMQDAAKLMRLGEGVTGIRLKLTDLLAAPRLAREIAYGPGGRLPGGRLDPGPRELLPALAVEKRMMTIILFLIVAVAAFNIVSTLVMVVTDKRSDIAILRTLGTSPGRVMGIFMVQGTAIGVVGTLLGVIGGCCWRSTWSPSSPTIEGSSASTSWTRASTTSAPCPRTCTSPTCW